MKNNVKLAESKHKLKNRMQNNLHMEILAKYDALAFQRLHWARHFCHIRNQFHLFNLKKKLILAKLKRLPLAQSFNITTK